MTDVAAGSSTHKAARLGSPCHKASASSSLAGALACCGLARSRALSNVSPGPASASTRVPVGLGSIPTQIDLIAFLLDAVRTASFAIGGDVGAHPAGERDFVSTVMRHEARFILAVAPPLLSRRVREPPEPRPLVPPAGLAQRPLPRVRRTRL
jgi:hypothetical protein